MCFRMLPETDEQMQIQVKNWWYFILSCQKSGNLLPEFGTG